MSRRVRLLVALGVFAASPAVAFDRSCNALQLVQQRTRIAVLPAGEQQRYQGTVERFDREMRALFDRTREQARELEAAQNKHAEAVFQARPDLVRKAQEEVLRANPELARPGAEAQLNLALVQKIYADPEFNRQLQRRLHADRGFDSTAASVLRTQTDAYHDLEKRQYEALLKVPPPQSEYERKAAGASSAFRDLMVSVAGAQAGARASLKQAGFEYAAAEIRKPFDTSGNEVVVAAESVRGAMRSLESVRLRSELDLQHADAYVAPAATRGRESSDRSRELPKAVAETVARAIRDRVGAESGYRSLSKIVVPPPPPAAAPPEQQQSWGSKVKETVDGVVGGLKYVLIEGE